MIDDIQFNFVSVLLSCNCYVTQIYWKKIKFNLFIINTVCKPLPKLFMVGNE